MTIYRRIHTWGVILSQLPILKQMAIMPGVWKGLLPWPMC